MKTERDLWLAQNDEEFLRTCRVEVCRGTGPGGQKRNKTSSAVRLTHLPSGIAAENDVTRSQHQNKANALKSLRLRLAIECRDDAPEQSPPLPQGPNARDFPQWAALALDALRACQYRLSDAAPMLGLSTGRLVRELSKVPAIWQAVNTERVKLGLHQLQADK